MMLGILRVQVKAMGAMLRNLSDHFAAIVKVTRVRPRT